MPYATLADLRQSVSGVAVHMPQDWCTKMLHTLPAMPTVDRVTWLKEQCAGKSVLHLGSGGPLHAELRTVAERLIGVDCEPGADYQVDLDWFADELPVVSGIDVVLLGEVLEHLCNPGFLLRAIAESYPRVTLLVTVPSAFAPQPYLAQGLETVHGQHVAWYSPQTLAVLLTRCGYVIAAWHCYNGQGVKSEGLIVRAKVAQQ